MILILCGYAAKIMASGIFVGGRSEESVRKVELRFIRFISFKIDFTQKQVYTYTFFGLIKRIAIYREGLGCTLLPPRQAPAELYEQSERFHPLGVHRDTNATDLLLDGANDLRQQVNMGLLERAIDNAFSENNADIRKNTSSVVVLYKGKLIAERYGKGFNEETPLAGWSMTKSVTNTLTGILVNEGLIDIYEPAPVPEWSNPNDPRHLITTDELLRMSSGLAFSEVYTRVSDATDMLFLNGDSGKLGAKKKLKYKRDTVFNYSGGSTNIVARILKDKFDKIEDYWNFPQEKLFGPLGMNSALMEVDAAGTFFGSSFMFATARDWAKYGQFYLQDGVWQGRRILPEGWVEYSKSPTKTAPQKQYGAQFWLNAEQPVKDRILYFPNLPSDAYYASGFEEQCIFIIPSKEVVVVRTGTTYPQRKWNKGDFIASILEAIPQ